MKKIFIFALIIFAAFSLAACKSEEAVQPKAEEASGGKDKSKTESSKQNEDKKKKEKDLEEIPDSEDLPAIPASFNESAEYPITGKFAGEKYTKEFTDQEEIKKALNGLPNLTEDSPKEDIDKVKRYILTLFKEDFSKINVPIDQWKSMQFNDPNGKYQDLQLKKNYNVAILLDSSGSMANKEGGKTRMELAKQAIQQFVKNLPKEANVSLRVYGHVGTGSDADKKASCSSIDEVYPLGKFEDGKFTAALQKFKPAGWTPMTRAIEQVKTDFQKYDGKENTNIIYVVSDGVETCGGDPVNAAKSLADSNFNPVINIIGYQVNNEGAAQLKKMADVSNGRFINAQSNQDIVNEFQQTVDMAKVWSKWHEDSTAALNQLHETIQSQLNQWYDVQQKLLDRENSNLMSVMDYLFEQKKMDYVYLEFVDDYRGYYLTATDEARGQYLDLIDTNRSTFLEKYDEVTDRFLDAMH